MTNVETVCKFFNVRPGALPVNTGRRYGKWLDGHWEGLKRPLSWLVEKFAPVPDWHPDVGGAHGI